MYLIDTVVLLADMLKILFPMQRNHRAVVFVQKQESGVSLYYRLDLRLLSIFNDTLETRFYFRRHRHHSCAAVRFGIFNHIFHVSRSLELMIHDDFVVFKINVLDRQAHKLRDTKSGLEQDEDTVIILAEMIVVPDKFQKGSLLLPCDRFSGNAVVDHNGIQLKFKGVLIQKVVVHRHLESRSNHTTDRVNGAVAPSIVL